MQFRNHPVWYIFCYLSSMFGILSGCGGGGSNGPSHTDYLSSIASARWEKDVVLYRVHGGPPNPLGSEVRRTIRRGIGNWDDAMRGYLTVREAQGAEQEDVSIRFVRVGSLGGDFFGRQTLGRTTLTYAREGVFSSATIEMDSQLWGRLPTMERIASHEVGCHGTFARGHSPYSTDVCYANPSRSSPSAADAYTFRLVYGGSNQ